MIKTSMLFSFVTAFAFRLLQPLHTVTEEPSDLKNPGNLGLEYLLKIFSGLLYNMDIA